MKSIFVSIILFIGIAMNTLAQEPGDKILGTWSNEDHTAQNEIYKKGNTYEAKITKGKAYVGTITMHDLKFDGKDWKGKANQPKSGRTADVILTLSDNNTIVITASKAGFTKTKNWYRVKQ